MAELKIKENQDILTYSESMRPIQNVQCLERWTNSCLNKERAAFRNSDGDYYCIKKDLP